jgi:hypothetical protein
MSVYQCLHFLCVVHSLNLTRQVKSAHIITIITEHRL